MNRFRGLSLSGAAFCATTLSFGLSLVACGGNSSSGSDDKGSNKIESVADKEELAHCTKSHYGELVHVEETDSVYECTSEGWQVVEDERLEDLLTRSSSSRKDDAKSSSSIAVSEGDTAKVEQVKVDSAKVTGLAQKGPYASGTVVTLYELDKDFNHTKAKFTGKIEGEKGEFAISDIVVENQYAELEANGFYMNEVTGKNTSGTKTKLTALVDLSEAKSVQANVNLFTEFEKARVIELVKNGLNVPAAKKRATQEILAAFGVKDSDVVSATAISLDDTTAAGVALQAASVMVIANQTIGKSNSLIADIADDFAQNGAWTDKEIRAIVADKVQNLDSAGTLRSSASDKVLREFWTSEYGIGPCTSELEEQVKKVDNKESANHGAGFVCTDARWHKTNEIDAELGLCTAKRAGAMDTIKSEKSVKYYMCDAGSWVELEETVYKRTKEVGYGCVDSLQNKVVKTEKDNYFVCKSGSWEVSDEINYELGECSKDREGEASKAAGSYYFCEAESWKDVSKAEYETGFYCTEAHLNEYKNEYVCGTEGWRKASAEEVATEKVCNASNDSTFVNGYACVKGAWREETAGEKANGDKFCNNDLDGFVSNGYACVDNAWRVANEAENSTKKVCAENIYKTVSDGYACKKNDSEYQWIVASKYEIAADSVCENTYLNVVKNKYMCENGQWRDATEGEIASSRICNSALKDTVLAGYACIYSSSDSMWRVATDLEKIGKAVCRKSIASNMYSYWRGDKLSASTTVICQDNGQWRNATDGEIATQMMCNKDRIEGKFYSGYKCVNNSGYQWVKISEAEETTGRVCSNTYRYMVYSGYICDVDDWRTATEAEIATGTKCRSDIVNQINNGYRCQFNAAGNYVWKAATDGERSTGKTCTTDILNSYYSSVSEDSLWYCTTSSSGTPGWAYMPTGMTWYEKDSRDGSSYKVGVIGAQIWMFENMNYKYDDDRSYCRECGTYGRFYNSTGAQESCSAFGDGDYYVPLDSDWIDLRLFVAKDKNLSHEFKDARDASVASYLKSANYWTGSSTGLDTYEFNARPAGFYANGNSEGKNEIAVFFALSAKTYSDVAGGRRLRSIVMNYNSGLLNVVEGSGYGDFKYDGTTYPSTTMKSLRCTHVVRTNW